MIKYLYSAGTSSTSPQSSRKAASYGVCSPGLWVSCWHVGCLFGRMLRPFLQAVRIFASEPPEAYADMRGCGCHSIMGSWMPADCKFLWETAINVISHNRSILVEYMRQSHCVSQPHMRKRTKTISDNISRYYCIVKRRLPKRKCWKAMRNAARW